MKKPKISLRLSRTLVALGLVGACTVMDKADYTFDDSPDGTGGTGGTGGKGGRGGTGGSTSGTSGTSTGGGEGGEGATAGGEGGAGVGGTSGMGGTGGKGGSSGKGGTGGNDPCDPDPCVHGDCSPAGTGYDCDCDTGWLGDECDVVVPEDCDPNPCQHGGTCVVDANGFRCTCVDGYTGVTCESGGPCDPNPCQGNGTCTVIRDTFMCACREGLIGSTCQSFGPTCREMRSGGVATADGVYTIDRDGGNESDAYQVYCNMTDGGITYEELAVGPYTSMYPGYELLTLTDMQNPRVQEAFIWSFNLQGGARNLNVGGVDGNCCFKVGGSADFLSIGTGPIFPADSMGYLCNGPYNAAVMQMYMYNAGIIATAPLAPNFFQLYPVSTNTMCGDGDNPAFFFERY